VHLTVRSAGSLLPPALSCTIHRTVTACKNQTYKQHKNLSGTYKCAAKFYCNSLRNEFQVTNNYKLNLYITEKNDGVHYKHLLFREIIFANSYNHTMHLHVFCGNNAGVLKLGQVEHNVLRVNIKLQC